MQKLTGDILRMNTTEAVYTAAGATVVVLQGGAPIASGTVDRDQHFEIELPVGTVGEVEVHLDRHASAPVVATVEAGKDLHIAIFYNNQQQFA